MESVHVPSVIKLVSVRPGPGPGPGLVAAVLFPPLYFWNCLCILDIFNKMHRYHFKIETTLTDPPSSEQKHKIYENTKKRDVSSEQLSTSLTDTSCWKHKENIII